MSAGAIAADVPPPPRTPLARRLTDILLWGGLAAVLIFSVHSVELSRLLKLATNSGNLHTATADFARSDFGLWKLYVAQMWLTVQMALWGTFLALIIAIPLGLAAARNLSPIWLQQPTRRLLDVLRSVPDLVVGTVFVAAVGLGPLAGVLALAVNTGGVLGKLFSESVEAIAPGPVEGVRATGAGPLQTIAWGVIPQVGPLWTSYGLYRLESNARSATVLGLIGAGGIGQTLFDSINAFAYGRTSAIVIVIMAAVTLIDLLSQVMRKRLM